MSDPISPVVFAALLAAALALVGALAFQAAYEWDLSNSISGWSAAHPTNPFGAFCGYAYRYKGPSEIGNTWLLLGTSAALAAGGATCLVLALVPSARGSRRRHWAFSAGVTEILLSVVVLGVNILVTTARVIGCQD